MTATGNVWTVPAGVPFVDALAAALMEETGEAIAAGDAMALARYTVLLPTRRACRSLAEAFLRASGGRPVLLPRLEPLGDVDEEELVLAEPGLGESLALPPAIAPTRRLLLLSRLVMSFHRTPEGGPPAADQAAWLACELARLLDQVHTEEIDFAGLAELVPEQFAAHWQATLEFLRIVTEHWPHILADEAAMDPVPRRTALLDARAAAWRARPPADPVLVAGSTGSVPATARLIATVAGLPQGRVVLPGLDRELDEASWQALDPAHPQYGLKLLLERLGVARSAVRDWPAPAGGKTARPADIAARAKLVSEIMRPAATSDAWRDMAISRREAAAAMRRVERVDCPTPQEEAGAVALALREVLETPGRTGALVTLDRGLARRVAAELRRWGVDIDDSAGQPLAATPTGSFLLLTARMAAEAFAPVALLAACKHPLAAAGLQPGAFRARLRRLERAVLRGPRPSPGIAGLRHAVANLDERHRAALGDGAEAEDLLSRLAGTAGGFADLLRGEGPLADLLRAHLACAEALAASAEASGAHRLWGDDAGERAARFVAEVMQAAAAFPAVPGAVYPGLLEALMSGAVVRPRYGRHPRLHIWGPLEARLQQADRIVLGGLNEGSWPREVEADPWMSRPMRARFGLPPAERRIGLSAHDFAQAFCAPEVLLTRAQRAEGSPSVPSRWLLRLETVLQALRTAPRRRAAEAPALRPWLAWQRALDAPGRVQPIAPPAPAPPVALRPRKLSVTQIETWLRNPYAIYARRVLRLEPLDPLDADPGAADYGTLIHRVLDRFLRAFPADLPEDAVQALLALGRETFRLDGAHPGVAAFWWPRFARVATWFVDCERRRRATLAAASSEVHGRLELEGPGGPFVLTAVADRIDRLADGTLAVIDYKTGSLPKPIDVRRGAAPQLPLEAAIALAGGFEDVPPASVAELAFWRVSGGNPPGEVRAIRGDAEELAARARAGLKRLVRRFDHADQAYLAIPRPAWAPRFDDYRHLARVQEWTATGRADDS